MKAAELHDPTTASTATRKRRFWQIHLSTALMLMLLASAFVYLNVHSVLYHQNMSEVGWPHPAVGWGPFITGLNQKGVSDWYCSFFGDVFVNWEYVGLDGLVLGVAVLVCAAGCEVLVRRRGTKADRIP